MICLKLFKLVGVLKLACGYRAEKLFLKPPHELKYSDSQIFWFGFFHRCRRHLKISCPTLF